MLPNNWTKVPPVSPIPDAFSTSTTPQPPPITIPTPPPPTTTSAFRPWNRGQYSRPNFENQR